jgi:hypothetical protein
MSNDMRIDQGNIPNFKIIYTEPVVVNVSQADTLCVRKVYYYTWICVPEKRK